ncbi:jg23311 [Pararge aegeria aegeria]|uniref:Jg23311 protein n=2 Tax=Pararge aegeria TaxID=116150 RepID=A0A8S4RAB7_9NEOP|nr:jg23311 [Pararge aegeria aegeria]
MMRPMVPPSRPNQAAMDKLSTLHRRVSSTTQPVAPGPTMESPTFKSQPIITMAKPMPMGVPPFKPLPPKEDTLKVVPLASSKRTYSPLQIPQSQGPAIAYQNPVPHQVHDLANNYPAIQYNIKKVDDYNTISGYSDDVTLKFNKEDINAKIAEIAKAGNISTEAVEAAIALRQQQLLSKYANIPMPTTTTSTTTTTEQPVEVYQLEPEPEIIVAPIPQKPKRNPTSGKVMNAPREYYPVGYEKNFDDHFQSKVDLPDTSFHCGDQKYFPGLYGDENLGCMVFHVCALTDDGLVMKSFLCPESTLFDQTILKCNWWFYVDCKNTVKLYDTNIPVSKSYQLMKALTFFSSYKKEMEEGQSMNPEDVEGVKEAITILENQDSKPAASDDVQIVTPLPIINERHSNKKDYSNVTSPVYRGTREYTNSTERKKLRRPAQPQELGDIRLITVNADINFNSTKENITNKTDIPSTDNSSERKRRRIASRNKHFNSKTTMPSTTTTTTSTTTQKPQELTTALKELLKQEIHEIENTTTAEIKQDKLTDEIENLEQIDPNILKEAEVAPSVRRFYRSSAELNNAEEKEITIVNNEKVQIVRPTPISQLTGEYPTQTATIAKLDEAVLGKYNPRFKKEVIAMVSSGKHETFLHPSRGRT